MTYTGFISSVSDRYSYKVTITYNDGTNNNQEIILADNDPIVITYESEDNPFAPIKTYSCTLNIVNSDYLFDLYSSTFDREVKVYDYENNILFRGYITPDIYNQDWDHTSVISIECISPIAMLKYKDYTSRSSNLKDLKTIILSLTDITGYTNSNIYYPKNVYAKYADVDGNEQQTSYDISGLCVDENNFYDDDEEQTPWKWYDVIEEICKYMAWQLIEYNNNLYFIPIDHIFYNPIPSTSNNQDANINPYLGSITKDSYASNSNNISLQQTYRKIKVVANTYPYEEVIPDIFDTSNLVFAYNGSPTMNNLDIPTMRWTSDTKKGEYVFYWLYCKSKNLGTEQNPRYIIHPRLYTVQYDNLNNPYMSESYIYTEQNRYIEDFNSETAYSSSTIGISILRATNYNVKEATVNSSLNWNNQITLHHGFNDSGAMRYRGSSAADFDNQKVKWKNYLNNYVNYGDKWFGSVDSGVVVTIKNGNYLVLSGKGMISNTGFEDPSIEEWAGKTNAEKTKFETANAYKVVDVGSQDRTKEYVGFPLFNIGLEVGDITNGGRQCVAMYMYKKKHDATNFNYKQASVTYQWIADSETPYVINPYTEQRVYMEDAADFDTNSYYSSLAGPWDQDEFDIKTGTTTTYDYLVIASSVIKIPVGTNNFSFYRWYDITNTCDWRMGLDNAKGFAIPVDHNLSGIVKVKLYGMDESIVDYPDDATSMKCFVYDGTEVICKPSTSWNRGYLWDDYEIVQYYAGTFPNYILLANLSLTINEQTYFTFSDLAFKNENNKGTDHEYSNIIDNNAITDYDDIELKINTQDDAKYRSFSSMMTSVSGTNYYITKMSKQDGIDYKIQEENIIDIYKDQYNTPKVLFDCDLKDRITGSFYPSITGSNYTFDTLSPFTYLYHPRTNKFYGVNGFTRKLFDESVECKLYEANIEPWSFEVNGVPVRRIQRHVGQSVDEPELINPWDMTGTWYSTDVDVATVDPNTGEVTIVGGGTAEIGISGSAGNASYEIEVGKADPNLHFGTGSTSVGFEASWYLPNVLINEYDVPIEVSTNPTGVVNAFAGDDHQVWISGNLATGSTIITASFSGSDSYLSGSASYELTVTKGNPSISWSTGSCIADIGGTNNFPTLNNPHNLSPITYSSSNNNVATISATGTINLISTGSCNIYASYSGSDNWHSTQSAYSLNVNLNYGNEYFTIEPLANGTVWFTKYAGPYGSIYYSNDKSTWSVLNSYDLISATQGQNIYFKGTLSPSGGDPYGIGQFGSSMNYNVSGNPISLLYGDNFAEQTSLVECPWAFYNLFKYNSVINAENLILTASYVAPDCYYGMFYGCSSLITPPKIQATTVSNRACEKMFENCTSLTTAPELPATVMSGNSCYKYMFFGCTSLTTAPELPATTLSDYCYSHMFHGCTSLTTAPELPATIHAYYNKGCYEYMFYGCTSLTTAPELPSTTLYYNCYDAMFHGCTSLTTAPELPATTLYDYCYGSMFYGCTSLTTAPELPATTLATGCYSSMFGGCTSLTTAPKLPATTLADNCYNQMFYDCRSLNYIKCLATDISASNCTNNWVRNVASTGTFVKDSNMNSWTTGSSGIHSGWTIENIYTEYFTIEPLANGTITFSNSGLQYSTDKYNWNNLGTSALTVIQGQNVYLKGNMTSSGRVATLSATSDINVSGNIMSLLYGDNFAEQTDLSGKNSVFLQLFYGNSHIINAQNLNLPATTLASRCYQSMFQHCSSLTTAPELPATTLATDCYNSMFYGTALTTAPELPATTLADYCYYWMFRNCANLSYIKCLATDISATGCTDNWVNNVAYDGTFVKDPNMNDWTTGYDGIPDDWTILNNN